MRDRIAGPLLKRLHSSEIHPVIVEARPGALHELAAQVRHLDLSQHVLRRLFTLEAIPFGFWGIMPRFNMVSAILSRSDIEWLADTPYVERVYLDRPKQALFFPTVPQDAVYTWHGTQFTTTLHTKKLIGAEDANSRGWTGRGVKVAVTDTGVALYHEQIGFRNANVDFETVEPFQRVDENGHGSWVCTCIGGSRAVDDRLSNKVGAQLQVEGIAPEVDMLCVKCLGYIVGTGTDSQILKALEIAYDWGADAINMSLGAPCDLDTPEDSPYHKVFDKIVQANAIPVVAAGNSGPSPGTLGEPGCLPQALTVGAYDPVVGVVANFSSRGPTPWGDVKPDVVAPGVNILSGCVGMLDVAVDKVVDRYGILSGTSMATPHVTGLVALMKQAHREVLMRELTVNEVKSMMEAWAKEHGLTKSNDYGWGPITWDVYVWWMSTEYGVNV